MRCGFFSHLTTRQYRHYTASDIMIDDHRTVNDLEESSSGLTDLVSRHLPGRTEEHQENLSQDSRCSARDSNRASPEQKSRPLDSGSWVTGRQDYKTGKVLNSLASGFCGFSGICDVWLQMFGCCVLFVQLLQSWIGLGDRCADRGAVAQTEWSEAHPCCKSSALPW
jgi:hypothetical protein